ncbi:hypothetical protein H8L32_05145 [Undibacterium sp. CY18W]|uniref:Bacteriocin-type signal sequence-containing protein n=1 Tax=Undibacterium hunanense TaxID=2762292 RepID=A0ABR6ZM32_9BURK|nr:hypothetical protein [Undibacterium hunanense]MBC3916854.1 hypothetical protein [Undibacterium hunanense]
MKTTELNTSEVEIKQHQSGQEHEMRILTDNEILSVAGGPEVDVESGG